MAIINNFTAACLKNFAGNSLNKQLSFVLRNFHKSAASDILGISEARSITPPDVVEETRVKTLKEMPGPSTLSNLIEFFWKDGFSRIHEIQVMLVKVLMIGVVRFISIQIIYCLCAVLCIFGISQNRIQCVLWHWEFGLLFKSEKLPYFTLRFDEIQVSVDANS